jgi:hypothetical protein
MLRRVVVLTAIATALSAVAAFAFAPRLGHLGGAWSRRAAWVGHGFTPALTGDAHTPAGDANQSVGGAPGTYCPIPARNSGGSAPTDQRDSIDTALSSALTTQAASVPSDAKNDLLAPLPAAMCKVVAPPTPAASILP